MRARLVSAVLASVVLGGCASGGDEAAPTEESSAASSEPGSAAPASPTTPATPEVAPATGAELKLTGATLRIPEDWRPDPTNTQDILVANGGQGVVYDGLGVVSLPGRGFPLDVQVDRALKLQRASIRLKRMPDIYLGGSPAYYLAGPDKTSPELWHVAIGGPYGERNYTMTFQFQSKSKAERDAVIDSVVASWEWK